MLQSLPEHLPYQASSLLRSVLGHVAVRYDVLKKNNLASEIHAQ